MRKKKLLICALFMSMVLTALPGMESKAATTDGEAQVASGLEDENSQRLEEVTATGANGSITEISEGDGTVKDDSQIPETIGSEEIALFAARSESTKVVNFNTKGNATTSYIDSMGRSGYTNGAYGADAAYLGTTGDGKIRFMLSGVTGTVAASEVQVLDYAQVSNNVSYYMVSGGKLLHYISQNLNTAPASALNNGPAPSYLAEGVKYYSYDGHYFYNDYNVMAADYLAGTNGASAVNAGNAFSNYFQFLDMRSSTSYNGDQLNSILNTGMANAWIDPASSKLTGTGTVFVENQNTYSVNALLSMGIAINESGWGTSWICMNKNNIFGLNAVDSSPGLSADTYASVDDCIRDFMKNWMANGYLSSSDWRNHGEYLGNKDGGINFSYASDPYWGEKAAAHAWNLDTLGGSQDYLGISGGDSEPEVPPTDETTPEEPGTEVPPTDETTPEEPGTEVPPTDETTPEEPGTEVPPTDETTPEEPGTEVPPTDETTPEEPGTEVPPTDETTPEEPGTEVPPTDETTPEEPGTEVPPAVTTPSDDESDNTTSVDVSNGNNTNNITITNTQQETKSTDTTRSPKTGDSSNAAVWAALLGLSAVLGAGVLFKRKTFR